MEYNENAIKFLKDNHLGVVTTVSKDGEPQGALIDFMAVMEDETLVIYFVSRMHSRKAENLKYNSRVGFVVGVNKETKTVQMQGNAKRLQMIEEIDHFFSKLEDRPDLKAVYTGESEEPWTKFPVDYIAVRVEIDWLSWLYLNSDGKPVYDRSQ